MTGAGIETTATTGREPGPSGPAPAGDASRSVFINCPFDPEYEPLFDALLLTVVMCGFVPRSALETGRARYRMERIFEAVYASDYSIHDLSRCRGEGEQVLARFNMPLELGVAMSKRRNDKRHDWCVLTVREAPYARFVSDLLGYDLEALQYDGSPESVIRSVTGWLVVLPQALPSVTPTSIIAKLSEFRTSKAQLKSEWGQIPWPKLVEAASAVAAGASPN